MRKTIRPRIFNPTSLMVVLGLQSIRLLFPGFVYFLRDTSGWSSLSLAPVALAVFALTILAAPLARWLGRNGSSLWLLMALVRLIEYFSRSPEVDLLLSIGGVVVFGMFISQAAWSAQRRGEPAGRSLVIAFILGIALDTAIHLAGSTLDLSWQNGGFSTLIVLLLTGALILSWVWYRDEPELQQSLRAGASPGWPSLAFGPFIFFQLLVFQNVGLAVALTGWSLPAAGLWIWLSTLLALLAVIFSAGLPIRRELAALLTGIAFVLAMAVLYRTDRWFAAVLLLVANVTGTVLWAMTVRALMAQVPGKPGRNRVPVMNTLGLLLFVTFSFLYYVSYDLSLGFRAPLLLPVIGCVLALLAFLASRTDTPAPSPGADWGALTLMAVFALPPILLGLNWRPVGFADPTLESRVLRLMTYNLHQGFNTDGALDIEALAQVIEASGADVIALQEITRSYVTNGSLDMVPWLSQRLGLPYYWGPTDPPQWGNALLSRYPIINPRNLPLPPDDLNLHRGYIDAGIQTGGGMVRIIATHLHHLGPDSAIRQVQVQALLAAWDGSPFTVIVGDLNATPDDPEMQLLAEAGLVESASYLGVSAPLTYYAANPTEQIDYIWLTPDLQPLSFSIPKTLASDHLPIVVDIAHP